MDTSQQGYWHVEVGTGFFLSLTGSPWASLIYLATVQISLFKKREGVFYAPSFTNGARFTSYKSESSKAEPCVQ